MVGIVHPKSPIQPFRSAPLKAVTAVVLMVFVQGAAAWSSPPFLFFTVGVKLKLRGLLLSFFRSLFPLSRSWESLQVSTSFFQSISVQSFFSCCSPRDTRVNTRHFGSTGHPLGKSDRFAASVTACLETFSLFFPLQAGWLHDLLEC